MVICNLTPKESNLTAIKDLWAYSLKRKKWHVSAVAFILILIYIMGIKLKNIIK